MMRDPARFHVLDATNIAGWSRARGSPRLAQVLALCRWAQRIRPSDMAGRRPAFVAWFDASLLGSLSRSSPRDAAVLQEVLRREPNCFKLAPSGFDGRREPIRADDFCLRELTIDPHAVLVSSDRYRAEAARNPELYGWVLEHPERLLPGQVASNGDLLLGAHGEIHIPVVDDAGYYLTHL